jgi:hypothetical protein
MKLLRRMASKSQNNTFRGIPPGGGILLYLFYFVLFARLPWLQNHLNKGVTAKFVQHKNLPMFSPFYVKKPRL